MTVSPAAFRAGAHTQWLRLRRLPAATRPDTCHWLSYEFLIARLYSGDIPDDAIRPVIDYFVTKVLAEWDAERTDQLRQVHEPGGA